MTVFLRNVQRTYVVPVERLEAAAQVVLETLGAAEDEVTVVLVRDPRIQALNRKWRGRNQPTDVLAFPLKEPEGPGSRYLGDVVISVDRAQVQAREQGHSLYRELLLLLIHGILHLLGYDHEVSAQEARRMRQQERRLLRTLESRGLLQEPHESGGPQA